MGLWDLFRMGRVLLGTAKAVRKQRNLGKELSMLPMQRFVPACLSCLNQSAGNWRGRSRPASASAAAVGRAMNLPGELLEFYSICDGFEAVEGEFPACIYPIDRLRMGAAHSPALSALLAAYWKEHGNESEKPGWLSVLPPDDLAALATHAADSYLRPSQVDQAVPLCPPDARDFVVILLVDAGENLLRGTVLEVEGGAATRYPGFKSWLATRASLFGSLPGMDGSSPV
jgi:hypothetical protein